MTSQVNDLVLNSVEDLYGRTLFSFKTHAKQSDIYKTNRDRLKITEIVMIALSGCGFLSFLTDFFSGGGIIAIIANFLSLGISIHLSSAHYDDLIREHLGSSHQLWIIKEQLLNSINDYKQNLVSVETLRTTRDSHLKVLHNIYSSAPQTSAKAYESARKALNTNEEHSFSQTEINNITRIQNK